MNIRHALILVVSVASLLSGCTTPSDKAGANEARIDKLMRHSSWPRIQQIARTEVKKREKPLGGWPDNAGYLPTDHKDKMWVVHTMTGTPNGDVERVISLMIEDDGAVLAYKRYWKGQELQELDQWP